MTVTFIERILADDDAWDYMIGICLVTSQFPWLFNKELSNALHLTEIAFLFIGHLYAGAGSILLTEGKCTHLGGSQDLHLCP